MRMRGLTLTLANLQISMVATTLDRLAILTLANSDTNQTSVDFEILLFVF